MCNIQKLPLFWDSNQKKTVANEVAKDSKVWEFLKNLVILT